MKVATAVNRTARSIMISSRHHSYSLSMPPLTFRTNLSSTWPGPRVHQVRGLFWALDALVHPQLVAPAARPPRPAARRGRTAEAARAGRAGPGGGRRSAQLKVLITFKAQ